MKTAREELIERIIALPDEKAEILYRLVEKYILNRNKGHSSLSLEELGELVRSELCGVCEKKDN